MRFFLISFLLYLGTLSQAQTSVHEWFFGQETLGNFRDFAVDKFGNFVLVGSTELDLDDAKNQGEWDAFIAYMSAKGELIWADLIGGSNYDTAISVVLDRGSIYVGGATGISEGRRMQFDVFTAHYTLNGKRNWLKQFGSSRHDTALDITTSADGNVYVTGYTLGRLPNQTNKRSVDIFVSKYSPSGTQLWLRQIGTNRYEKPSGLVAVGSRVYVGGYTYGKFVERTKIPGVPLFTNSEDGFVLSLSTDGDVIHAVQLGTVSIDSISAIAADADGNIIVAGETLNNANDEGEGLPLNAFVSKLSPDLELLWWEQIGTMDREDVHTLTVDSEGNSLYWGRNVRVF